MANPSFLDVSGTQKPGVSPYESHGTGLQKPIAERAFSVVHVRNDTCRAGPRPLAAGDDGG